MITKTDNKNLLYSLLMLFLFAGCATQPLEHKPKAAAQNASPYWVNNPDIEGYLAVSASAMPQNIGGREGQRRAALLRARAKLAKIARVFVRKELSIEKKSNQTSPLTKQKITVSASELQQLTHAYIKDQWLDEQSGELFIWYIVSAK